MQIRNKAEKRVLNAMERRGFPGSVRTTVIWATRRAEDSKAALAEVEKKLASGATAKEMVKFVQPMFQ